MGNTHVFSTPVLAYRPKMWTETWQQRHVTIQQDSTLHVSHGPYGKPSYTINLKLLSPKNILFGRRQIRSLGAPTSKPFPTDLYMDTDLNCLVDIDRSFVIFDPTPENAAQDGNKNKEQKFHALSFTSQKHYARFLTALAKLGLFPEVLKEAMEHQPTSLEHATAYDEAMASKNISVGGHTISIPEVATVLLVVFVFLWILKYTLWTTEEDL